MSRADDLAQPFAAGGGTNRASQPRRDPFEALDDLMAVVEALCPVWPERPTFAESGPFLL